MSKRYSQSFIPMLVLGVVTLAPATLAELAACMANRTALDTCDRCLAQIPSQMCSAFVSCSARAVSNSECSDVGPVKDNEVGKNNTVSPTPMKSCVYVLQACQQSTNGNWYCEDIPNTQTTQNYYCPEIAGEVCNGGINPGGGGGGQ